jgi:hypothetical protein
MIKIKINHPYHTPDDFFENFRKELLEKVNTESKQHKLQSIVLTILKYAAIVVFSFILGRESVHLVNLKTSLQDDHELFNVEAVLGQVSDDDITNYLLENATEDIFQ